MSITKTFKDLIVWNKAKDLAVVIYKLTEGFPKTEEYGLTNQMRRAAISISSNIAVRPTIMDLRICLRCWAEFALTNDGPSPSSVPHPSEDLVDHGPN